MRFGSKNRRRHGKFRLPERVLLHVGHGSDTDSLSFNVSFLCPTAAVISESLDFARVRGCRYCGNEWALAPANRTGPDTMYSNDGSMRTNFATNRPARAETNRVSYCGGAEWSKIWTNKKKKKTLR